MLLEVEPRRTRLLRVAPVLADGVATVEGSAGLLPDAPARLRAASVADVAHDTAMEFDDLLAAGPLMQAIDILGDQGKTVEHRGHFCQCVVSGIGLHVPELLTPPLIPLPNTLRIFLEGLWSRQILRSKSRPQAGLRLSEGGNAAFRRRTGAGRCNDAVGLFESFDKLQADLNHVAHIDVTAAGFASLPECSLLKRRRSNCRGENACRKSSAYLVDRHTSVECLN